MNIIDQIYEDAMWFYREDTTIKRFYHTDMHIRNMLDGWDRIVQKHKVHLNIAFVSSIAIIYHDIVYDPTRKDNERKSADFMRSELYGRLKADDLDFADEIIMQTTHTDDNCTVWEHNIIRDLDLRGLGGSFPEYRRNTWQIFQEYSPFVPMEQFLEGRKQFLSYMLGKNKIYRTDEFAALESPARKNMEVELSLLQTPEVWKHTMLK